MSQAPGAMPSSFPPGHWQMGNYTTLQIQLLSLFPILLFSSLVVISLRVWSRRIKHLQMGLNDYFALASTFFNLVYFIILLLSIFLGAGRDIKDMRNPPEQIHISLHQVNIAVAIFWAVVNTLVKLSMADLYTTLFPSRTMRITAYTFTFLTLTNFIFAIAVAGFAGHSEKSPLGRARMRDCYVGIGTINLLLDIFVIGIPMPSLWKLKLPVEKKVSLMGIFALGLGITGISAVRVAAFSSGLKDVNANWAYNTYALPLWSFLETTLSVINCCLPVMFPALLAIGKGVSGWFGGMSVSMKGSASSSSSSSSSSSPVLGSESTPSSSASSITGKSAMRQQQPSETSSSRKGFLAWWKKERRAESTLPIRSIGRPIAQPSAGIHTSVSGGAETTKQDFFVKEARLRDEESRIGDEKMRARPGDWQDQGKIMVERGWRVDYGARGRDGNNVF